MYHRILGYQYGKIYKKQKNIMMYNNIYICIQYILKKKYIYTSIINYKIFFIHTSPTKLLNALLLLNELKNTIDARYLSISENKNYLFIYNEINKKLMYQLYIFEKYMNKPTKNRNKKYAYLYYLYTIKNKKTNMKYLYLYIYLKLIHLERDEILNEYGIDIVEKFTRDYNSYYKLYEFLKENGYIKRFYKRIPDIEKQYNIIVQKIETYQNRPILYSTFEKSIMKIGDIMEDMEKYSSSNIDKLKIKKKYLKIINQK